MSHDVVICISVGDPCISLANLFCRNHENENVSGPGPDRFLDVAAVNAHARYAHEDEVDSSKSSRCVDDTAQGTHGDLDQSRHVEHHRVDHHPCESGVVGLASGCHHPCGGEASPDGGDAVGMAIDCHLAHGGEASPDEGGVVGVVTDCLLAHGGVANRGDNDEAVLTSDDEKGGRETHLTNPIRCRNLTTYCQRTNPRPIRCQKTTIQPLTSRDVAP
jgi:hypothetical protein